MNTKIRNRILTLAGKLALATKDHVHVILYYHPKESYWSCSITIDRAVKIPYFYVHQNVRQNEQIDGAFTHMLRITNSTAFSGIASLECILKFFFNKNTKNTNIAQVEKILEQRIQELKDQHNEQERKANTRSKPLEK